MNYTLYYIEKQVYATSGIYKRHTAYVLHYATRIVEKKA